MPTMQTLTLLAYAGALAATLVLAAVLTPASWWKRPNLLAACVLAGGTWGLGGLALQWLSAGPAQAAAPVVAGQQPAIARLLPASGSNSGGDNSINSSNSNSSSSGRSSGSAQYVVRDDLNLRQGASTASARLAVVPVGALVTTTGLRNGDWWQVSAKVGDAQLTGWSNSLWLRRAKEGGQ